MITLQRTPLFDVYAKYGGKQSTSVVGNYQFNFQALKKEHEAYVQSGLFDVSHMGEVEVKRCR